LNPGFLLFALAACGGSAPPSEATAEGPAIRTAQVEQTAFRPQVELTGSLDPVASVQLGFDVPGRLQTLLAARGARVEAGDPVATLDRALPNAQLAQASAAVAAAQAGRDAAEQSWGRLEKVGTAVSEQQRSEVHAQVETAKAGLAQAQAAERMARTQLGYHTLRAPIAGLVTQSPDNPGALVAQGDPLFVIEDLSALRLKGTAPETETWLVPGLEATVYPGTPGATAGVPGTVETVIPSLDPATRRIPVEVVVRDPPPTLRAHSFGRVVISAPADETAWRVPKGALVARPDFSVLVLREPGSEPVRVPVAVLQEGSDQVVVSGELSAGDEVVVDPPHGYGG
jgi:RND family efflux transporter MFP subunit